MAQVPQTPQNSSGAQQAMLVPAPWQWITKDGAPSQQFFELIHALWVRTGGASAPTYSPPGGGNTAVGIAALAAQVASATATAQQALYTALMAELTTEDPATATAVVGNFFQLVQGSVVATGTVTVGQNLLLSNNTLLGAEQLSAPLTNGDTINPGLLFDSNGETIIVPSVAYDGGVPGTVAPVTRIIAGSGIVVSPASGIGDVTVTATAQGSSYSGTTASLLVTPTPLLQTAIDSCTITFTASAVARIIMVNFTVTYSAGHGMRGGIILDGTKVWPTGQQVDWIGSGDGIFALVASGVVLTIPGDNTTHTVSASWASSGSTGGLTLYDRWIVATVIG